MVLGPLDLFKLRDIYWLQWYMIRYDDLIWAYNAFWIKLLIHLFSICHDCFWYCQQYLPNYQTTTLAFKWTLITSNYHLQRFTGKGLKLLIKNFENEVLQWQEKYFQFLFNFCFDLLNGIIGSNCMK